MAGSLPTPASSHHLQDPFVVKPTMSSSLPPVSHKQRPSSSSNATRTPPSYSTPITPGRRTPHPFSTATATSTSKSSTTPSNTTNSSRKKSSSSLSTDRPAAAKKPRLSNSNSTTTTLPPPFFPILTRAESVDPLEEENLFDREDRDPLAMDDIDDAPLSFSYSTSSSSAATHKAPPVPRKGRRSNAAAAASPEVEVKEEEEEDEVDDEVRMATMIVDAVEIEEGEEGEGSDFEEEDEQDERGNDLGGEDYQQDDQEEDEDDQEGGGGGDVFMDKTSSRKTRTSARVAAGAGRSVLDEFVQGVAAVVGGVVVASGTRKLQSKTSASTGDLLPKSSEEPEPTPPRKPTPSSNTARPESLVLAGTGTGTGTGSTSISSAASSSRKKFSGGSGTNGGGGGGGEEEEGSSPSKDGEEGEGRKKSAGGGGNGSGSGGGGGGGGGGDKRKKDKEEKDRRDRDQKEREEVERLGLEGVWESLRTDITSLLETALEAFQSRISDRIRTAMAYPPVEIDPSSPALASFLKPYLLTLRPTLINSLLTALPTIETRDGLHQAASPSRTFQERDYEELLFAPLHTLLTSTTETLQSAAFDRVLASFPSILGEEPREEVKALVDRRKGNVLKKVKEGVRLVLEKEEGAKRS